MGEGLRRAFAAAKATRQAPMRVLFCKDSSDHRHVMWEVSAGDAWWVAVWNVAEGGWTITGGKSLREVSATGTLGKRIIAAVEAAK